MRDAYDVLGVPRSASEAEIKDAYRTLAKALHPDAHSSGPYQADRFKAGIPHMEPSQPVECDSKPLDVQFAFE